MKLLSEARQAHIDVELPFQLLLLTGGISQASTALWSCCEFLKAPPEQDMKMSWKRAAPTQHRRGCASLQH